ncbi:MAG: HNH endonuclease [Planctomycetota bacterium]
MRFNCNFNMCILCLKNPADSWEHIIPESIGGRLQINVLCSVCNKALGSKLVSRVKSYPSIRLAIKNLKNTIPKLYSTIENSQLYDAKDKQGNFIKLRYKDSKFRVVPHTKKDGSVILDSQNNTPNIEQMLKSAGLPEDRVIDKINFLRSMEENKVVQLSETVRVAKWSLESISPSLKGPLLDGKIVALIAYEFLSLLVGETIYDDRLDFIRIFIKGEGQSPSIVIERLSSKQYGPIHGIYPEFLDSEIIINIVLFRWLVFKVHFTKFRLKSNNYVYSEDLINKKTYIEESIDKEFGGQPST